MKHIEKEQEAMHFLNAELRNLTMKSDDQSLMTELKDEEEDHKERPQMTFKGVSNQVGRTLTKVENVWVIENV